MTALPDSSHFESLTDSEIVCRVLAGETSLFEQLMRRYNQRVYRTVRSILHGDRDAEDVMQQAYLNAYAHLARFEERSGFATWLTRIAVNEALARIRPRRLLFVEHGAEIALERVESPRPGPEENLLSAELKKAVESEVAALPATYRSVLILREIEGLTTSEAAACLGVSEELIKTRLHRARTILRDNLYRRAGLSFESLFTFGRERCDRLVTRVMREVRDGWEES
jgi:RNA polymerase sigma-70 factor (ECF subfamily)